MDLCSGSLHKDRVWWTKGFKFLVHQPITPSSSLEKSCNGVSWPRETSLSYSDVLAISFLLQLVYPTTQRSSLHRDWLTTTTTNLCLNLSSHEVFIMQVLTYRLVFSFNWALMLDFGSDTLLSVRVSLISEYLLLVKIIYALTLCLCLQLLLWDLHFSALW